MIKVKHVVVLAFLVGMFPFCGKNPAEPPADDTEERILFIRGTPDFSEICTMSPEGSDIQVIAHYDYGDDYYWQGYRVARWLPDKNMLIVAGGPGSTNEYVPLWLMDMEGTLVRKLTWNGHEPYWATENKVIFTRRRGYFSLTTDVFEIDVTTLEEDTILVAEVGPPGTNSGNIYWLRDVFIDDGVKLLLSVIYTYMDSSGKAIADDSELLIYDIEKKGKIFLTENDLEEGWASASQDGEFIAFTRRNPETLRSTSNLFIMTSIGEDVQKITTGLADEYSQPVWSPDGERLVVTRADQSEHYNPYKDIFILYVSTGEISQLTTNAAKDSIIIRIMGWR